MQISLSTNIREVLGWTAALHPQFRFAVAKSLTDTARVIQRGLPGEMERALDKPTPFTKSGTYIVPARKDGGLQATVGIKDRQAEYLAYQVEGGIRPPKSKALRLPSVVELNAYGNLPPGLIRQLVARARAGKRATTSQAKRFGVSKDLDLFYGEPGDGRPAGIYKRVVISATRHQLVPIVVFPKRSARYSRRLDFHGYASRVTDRDFDAILAANWRMALATAKR